MIRSQDLADAGGDPMLGRTLDGRFTVLAKLGAGSMGTVYRAKQAPMGRDVAIKILRSDRAVDNASKGRFLREARANSVLTSPHTVTVFDFGQSESGELYLAMELLEGESLGQRLKRVGRLSIDAAIDTSRQALRSLAEAHAKGIIHRDLKPDNLFYARVLNANGTHEEIVKVVDFGIAKLMHDDGGPAMNAVETQAGTVFGTPRYMSPEQAQGKPLDARSDLYSLGVILYHCLTGRPPFTDDDAIVVMARHIKTMPKAPSEACPEARIPAEVDAVVMRALAKEPGPRPESADAMAQDIMRAKELAQPVVSGVRASLAPAGIQQALETPRTVQRDTARPPRQRSDHDVRANLADDSLSLDVVPNVLPKKRGMLIAALSGLAVVAIFAGALYAYRAMSDKAPAAAPATSSPPAATAAAASAAPVAHAPTKPSGKAVDLDGPDPGTQAVDPSTLPLVPSPSAVPTSASAPPHPSNGRPPRGAGPRPAPPPPTPAAPAPTPQPKYPKFE